MRYDWPGNVRELENACERIAQTCTCGVIRVGCLAANLLFGATNQPPGTPAADPRPTDSTTPISLDGRLRDLEASLITWALKASGGNKSKAAQLLQVKRSTLGDRIKHCGLDQADFPATRPPRSDVDAA